MVPDAFSMNFSVITDGDNGCNIRKFIVLIYDLALVITPKGNILLMAPGAKRLLPSK